MSNLKCFISMPLNYDYVEVLKALEKALTKRKIIVTYPSKLGGYSKTSELIDIIQSELKTCTFVIADLSELRIGVLTEVMWSIEYRLPLIVISNAWLSPKEMPSWIFDIDDNIGPRSKLDNFEYLVYFAKEDLLENIDFVIDRILYKKGLISTSPICKQEKYREISIKVLHGIASIPSSIDRGKQFEEFVSNLIESISGLNVAYRRYHSDFGEFDIVVRNNKIGRPWEDISFFFPIECKWKDSSKRIGVKDLRDFCHKVKNLNKIKFGIMFTNTSFTKELIAERNRILSSEGITVCLISGNLIETAINKNETIEKYIVQSYERASLGDRKIA